MILAVQNFKTRNFKANSANYDVRSNAMSKVDNSKAIADSFIKSNQIAFKGNLAKVGEKAIGDLGSKIKRAGEGVVEAAGGTLKKITGERELPFVEIPIISPSLKGERDAALSSALSRAKDELKSRLSRGEISQSTYNSKVSEMTSYYDHAKGLDPMDYSSRDIISGQPSFRGVVDTSDAGDVASEAVGEGTIEAGKEVASEAGQFIVEETIGEAGYQAVERAIDCVLPGVGGLMTLARWGRRIYKAGKIIDKL